jgi:hypothetical protein
MEIWSKSEHKDPREFYNLSNDWWNSEFRSRMKELRPIEIERSHKI